MDKIPLTQGKEAIVSAEDYDYLMQWKWCAHKDGNKFYAVRYLGARMHREILKRMGIEAAHTDHIDGDGLNNVRENLRGCTAAENQRNRGKQRNNTSGEKGVSWHKRDRKWHARIMLNGKSKHLGCFNNPQAAKEAYAKAARELHGEFHHLA